MSDDYLWDKSGDPDSEIEELEQLLGTLGYRPPASPLPLIAAAPVSLRRFFRPALAVAAALLFAAVAGGLWLTFTGAQGQRETVGISAVNMPQGSAVDWMNPDSLLFTQAPTAAPDSAQPGNVVAVAGTPRHAGPRPLPNFKHRQPAVSQSESSLANISNDEGVAAREQLIKALHLASSKLNLVQKKIQDNKSLGPES